MTDVFTLRMVPCYIDRKPRGPVLENTLSVAIATPIDKRGFVMPKFRGWVRLHLPSRVMGEMGLPVRMAARLLTCFQHLVHLMRLKTQTVVLLNPVGTKTMTAITQQDSCAAASSPTTGTLATTQISTVLAAFNAANLASSYIERGNFAAARRKLVLALASVNQLTEG